MLTQSIKPLMITIDITSPEVIAQLSNYDKHSYCILFTGSFCFTCGFYDYFDDFVGTLLAIAAGGFIYLASSELIPEMQREIDLKKSIIQFSLFIVGLSFIMIMNAVFPE